MNNRYRACVSCGRPLNYDSMRRFRRCPCCGKPISYVGEDEYVDMVQTRNGYDRGCEVATISVRGNKICDILVATM